MAKIVAAAVGVATNSSGVNVDALRRMGGVLLMTMRRASIVALLVAAATGPLTPANAGIPSDPCTFDAPSASVTLIPEGGFAQLHLVNGDEIWASGDPCDGADTSTTDTIVVTAAPGDEVEITLATGPFAPGKTPEGDASSEIEFVIGGGPLTLTITGSDDPDRISAGAIVEDAVFNLNAGEWAPDADVTIPRSDLIVADVRLGGRADTFSGAGVAEPGTDPFQGGALNVDGGPGGDVIHGGLEGAYAGDTAAVPPVHQDTFSLSWLPTECQTIIVNGPGGTDSDIDCPDTDTTLDISFFETMIGHGGEDWIFPAGWGEMLYGRGGNDTLTPGVGDDVLVGGPGWDRIVTSPTGPVRVDLTNRRIIGESLDTYAGIEGIYIDSADDDRFVGQPGGSMTFISGGGGGNVVNLSTSVRRFEVHTVSSVFDGSTIDPSEGLWVHGALVIGTPFDDHLLGQPGAFGRGRDEFRGGDGDDVLEGGGGPDSLRGGDGDDRIDGGPGTDVCSGGPGFDIVQGCEG